MRCPQCRHENPQQAKFCSECGLSLIARCVACIPCNRVTCLRKRGSATA
jgi:zinc-ribbon domain